MLNVPFLVVFICASVWTGIVCTLNFSVFSTLLSRKRTLRECNPLFMNTIYWSTCIIHSSRTIHVNELYIYSILRKNFNPQDNLLNTGLYFSLFQRYLHLIDWFHLITTEKKVELHTNELYLTQEKYNSCRHAHMQALQETSPNLDNITTYSSSCSKDQKDLRLY